MNKSFKNYISEIIRVFIGAAAFVLLIWVNCNFFTAGTVIGSALFGGTVLLCIFWKPFCRLLKRIWSKIGGKIALCVVGAFAAVCAGFCAFFSVQMAVYAEKPLEEPSAVIVLGCQVRGETPSLMLARRCDAAFEVLEEFPEAVCVVSGGQGHGEDISEAEAMRRYLVDKGVSEERILLEDKSTSTKENLEFSAEILKTHGIEKVIIATNEFHQYRAEIYARQNKLTAGHHSNRTPRHNLLNYWVREWAALMKQLIVDS